MKINMSIEKIKVLIYKYPILRKFLHPAIVARRFLLNKKRRCKEEVYENLLAILIEDPIIKVNEFQGIFTVNPSSDIFKILLINKEYEPSLVNIVLRYIDEDRDAIDIGANIGFYAVLFAKILNNNRRVLSIEPTKNAFQRLRKNIKLNDVEEKVILFEGCASNYSGKTKIKIIEGKEEYSTVGALIHPSIQNERYILQEVEVKTLDELVEKYSFDPGFIKIDVEGVEHFVFEGSKETLRTKRPVILSELSDFLLKQNGSSAIELIKLIKSYKYKVIDAENPEIPPHIKEFTNIIAIPEEVQI